MVRERWRCCATTRSLCSLPLCAATPERQLKDSQLLNARVPRARYAFARVGAHAALSHRHRTQAAPFAAPQLLVCRANRGS